MILVKIIYCLNALIVFAHVIDRYLTYKYANKEDYKVGIIKMK